MHCGLPLESELAWRSFRWFTESQDRVGAGDPGYVRTGFVQPVGPGPADALRANVANQRALAIATQVAGPGALFGIIPGMVVDYAGAAAFEPLSG